MDIFGFLLHFSKFVWLRPLKQISFSIFLFIGFQIRSQEFLGLQTGNYAGVIGALQNPANIVDNRYAIDVALAGFDVNIDNNYFAVKNTALQYQGSIFKPKTLHAQASWKDKDKKSTTYYKNNFTAINNNNAKYLFASGRGIGPSFMMCLNPQTAVALNINVRSYLNMRNLSHDLADIIFYDFPENRLLNNSLNAKNINITQASWIEYAFTFAKVIEDKKEHFFKAGVSPKLLQGIDAAYLQINELDYYQSTSDTNSHFRINGSYGYSANLDTRKPEGGYITYKGLGLDIGGVYEYRPHYKDFKYNMDGKKNLNMNDKNKYLFRAGFSILDLGRMRFERSSYTNDFEGEINRTNFYQFEGDKNFTSIGKKISKYFASTSQSGDILIILPTHLNLNFDYNPNYKNLFFNANITIGNFRRGHEIRIYQTSNISFTPRYETGKMGFALPFTFSKLPMSRYEVAQAGVMLRYGFITLGTNNLLGFFKNNLYGASTYLLFKIPILYKHPKDNDHDEISNKMDHCIDVPGILKMHGCPDTDNDQVPDDKDQCPYLFGEIKLHGCPDKDHDGIADNEDACPDSAGTKQFHGCPDTDHDKIVDTEDECPYAFGLKIFNGCPDTDNDGIPDKEDACPTLAGLKKWHGCSDKDTDGVFDHLDKCPETFGDKNNEGCPWPDLDKDGVPDKDDSCKTIAGKPELKGCPPPLKIQERKLIEKAMASLEFETGNNVIKNKSKQSLKELSILLVKHSSDWTIKLSGHTDNIGTPENNMILSEKRTMAVKDFFILNGVNANNIVCEWFGQEKPIADNNIEKGRQANRRVEMKIIYME